MENTLKQQAIEKAYGKNWDAVKDYVDENGACRTFRFIDKEDPTLEELGELCFHDVLGYSNNEIINIWDDMGPLRWCPKELEGIENNNGWIKINDESDLPKENHHFIWAITENNNKLLLKYHVGKGFALLDKWGYLDYKFTHWQQLVIPDLNVY